MDVKAAKKYLTLVQQGFQAENIHNQVVILVFHCICTGKCTLDHEQILNNIDDANTQILLCVEVECKKAKGYAWSPLLTNARCTIIAAKWHLSAVVNGWLQIWLMDWTHAIINAKKQLKEAYAGLHNAK